MDVTFSGEVWEWRGPAPFHWLSLPPADSDAVRAANASYGWGAVPVRARLGGTEWETSLLPKDGGYVLPLKVAVRRAEGVELGDVVAVSLRVAPRDGRQANGTGPAG
jgi:hypothetical protein